MSDEMEVHAHKAKRDAVISEFRARAQREKQYGAGALALILVISFAVTWWFLYLAMDIPLAYKDMPSAILGVVGMAILRLGSVAISLYIISILYNFSTNRFRLYDVLNSRADILMLYSGDFNNIDILFKIISVDKIGFGKKPLGMHEKALDLACEAIKKIPTTSAK